MKFSNYWKIRPLQAVNFLLALFFYACSSGTPLQTEKFQETQTPTKTNVQPTAYASESATPVPVTAAPTQRINSHTTSSPTIETPGSDANINPLTGLEVEKLDNLNRRPIAVKVQLFPRGQRPPWGISSADIVYDYYQNNGVTRLTAIFYGEDAQRIGPIRSARLFDLNIIKMYKSLFIFGLADWRIYQKLLKSVVSDRLVVEKYGSCPPLCRIEPESYNHLMVDTSTLEEYLSDIGISNDKQNLDGMVFSEIPPENGIPAEDITIRISHSAYSRWVYDPETGYYQRYQDTQEAAPQEEVYEPLVDQLIGEQISSSNVIILFLAHKYAYQTEAGDNEVFNIRFSGEGEAVAIRDGLLFQISWSRGDTDAPLILTMPDGFTYPYKPGKTWFQLLGKTSSKEKLSENRWRFEFKVP